MDDKNQYNVWARTGNRWDAVLNVTVSQATAETLASLLAHENRVPHDDLRFVSSIGRPSSMGFAPDPVTVQPATSKLAGPLRKHTR